MGYIVFDAKNKTFNKKCNIEENIKSQNLIYIHHSSCKLRSHINLQRFSQIAQIKVCKTSYGKDLFYEIRMSDLHEVGINSLKFSTDENNPNEGKVTMNVADFWSDDYGRKHKSYRNLDFDWFMNDENDLIIHKNWELVYKW